MADNTEKVIEEGDIREAVDQMVEDPQDQKRREQLRRRHENTCRAAIRNIGRTQSVWWMVILLSMCSAFTGLFISQNMNAEQLLEFTNWKFESWASVALGLIFVVLAISRITSNNKVLRKLQPHRRNKYLRGPLPEESDAFIREAYFFFCRRRCIHFWLSVCFGCLSMLCILYPIVATCISMLASWSLSEERVKLFRKDLALDPSQWEIAHKFVALGILGVFLTAVQYFSFKDSYNKPTVAFEERYGREKIVDECLYTSRMWKVNFRYKSFAFMIVCFCGCLFYLLFKRLICVIFDKSFTF